MVMQTHTSLHEVNNARLGKIRLLPAWPEEWDVDFKLHAPGQTTVEVVFNQGEFTELIVNPESRRKDLIFIDGEDKNQH
jgi:hypothetical protein